MSIAGVTGSSSAALAQELQRQQGSTGPGAAATTGSTQQAAQIREHQHQHQQRGDGAAPGLANAAAPPVPRSDDATAAVDTTA
jgi:hypothetical protein